MRTLVILFLSLLVAVACDTGKTHPPKDELVIGDADTAVDVDQPILLFGGPNQYQRKGGFPFPSLHPPDHPGNHGFVVIGD